MRACDSLFVVVAFSSSSSPCTHTHTHSHYCTHIRFRAYAVRPIHTLASCKCLAILARKSIGLRIEFSITIANAMKIGEQQELQHQQHECNTKWIGSDMVACVCIAIALQCTETACFTWEKKPLHTFVFYLFNRFYFASLKCIYLSFSFCCLLLVQLSCCCSVWLIINIFALVSFATFVALVGWFTGSGMITI